MTRAPRIIPARIGANRRSQLMVRLLRPCPRHPRDPPRLPRRPRAGREGCLRSDSTSRSAFLAGGGGEDRKLLLDELRLGLQRLGAIRGRAVGDVRAAARSLIARDDDHQDHRCGRGRERGPAEPGPGAPPPRLDAVPGAPAYIGLGTEIDGAPHRIEARVRERLGRARVAQQVDDRELGLHAPCVTFLRLPRPQRILPVRVEDPLRSVLPPARSGGARCCYPWSSWLAFRNAGRGGSLTPVLWGRVRGLAFGLVFGPATNSMGPLGSSRQLRGQGKALLFARLPETPTRAV